MSLNTPKVNLLTKEYYMADLSTKSVAILVDNYFEQSELEHPLQVLKDNGVQVTVVSTSDDNLHAMHHAEMGDNFSADIHIDDADFEAYDMLIVPGGTINADTLRMNDKAQQWVRYCMDNALPLAAICHAPWLLISAGITDGLKLTSFISLQDDIRNAGGEWVDEELVIDANVITSRNPDDLPAFCSAIKEALEYDETATLV